MPISRNKRCFYVKKAEDKGNIVEDLDPILYARFLCSRARPSARDDRVSCIQDPTELVALEDYLNNEENSEEEQSESDSDEEPENLVDLSFNQLTFLIESSPLKLISDVKAIVKKVRTTVRKYRKSPLKDEVLQGYIKADHGQPKALVLDVKTRWSSLTSVCDVRYFSESFHPDNESPN